MVKLRRVYESELYLESQKDLDDLKAYLGDKLFDDYMKIRDRISKDQNDFKDFGKLKKKDKKDIQDFVSSFQSKGDKKKQDKTGGAKKIYDGKDWIVYKITSYPAAQLYGKDTKWCITGRYPGHEGRGEGYFNDYINQRDLDGGYYFFIDKHNSKRKFCALRQKSGNIDSIWNAEDSVLSDVDHNDAPFDLEDISNDLPGDLGDGIMEYLEYSAGENFDPIDALERELSKGPSTWDIDKIKDYAESVGGFGLDDFDEFYKLLVTYSKQKIEDDKVEAFRILSEYELPTTDIFSRFDLDTKVLNVLVSVLKDNPDSVDDEYFNSVFMMSFNDGTTSIKDLVFLFKHSDFSLEDINYVLNGVDDKYTISFLKSLVEDGQINLNDPYFNNESTTLFYGILDGFNPSVDDVKWMIAHGADPDKEDENGNTALDYTTNKQIQGLLKK